MYEIKRLWLEDDKQTLKKWQTLLRLSGLSYDEPVAFTLGIFDKGQLVATGSFDQNIIKCVTVSKDYQSENLLGTIVNHLMIEMRERRVNNILVYTKPENAIIFSSIGFKRIIETNDILFMETGTPNFEDYLNSLPVTQEEDNTSIVMNANPFTKGHLYLVEQAAKAHKWVYVFVVSEDVSCFSTEERMLLVKTGVAHLKNVSVLPTSHYIVSAATFPTYFLKERADLTIAKVQANLDAVLFRDRIAPRLKITSRYVGEEPLSEVTNVYNEAMQTVFGNRIKLVVLPRMTQENKVISATRVRQAFKEQDYVTIKKLVPTTTYQYLKYNKNRR